MTPTEQKQIIKELEGKRIVGVYIGESTSDGVPLVRIDYLSDAEVGYNKGIDAAIALIERFALR